ncbi:MAG: hypothetical protein LR011_14015 [Verrucomicrobia bacterium]|nr:hypothetical protein [Verrucomicrobiota bacterium]
MAEATEMNGISNQEIYGNDEREALPDGAEAGMPGWIPPGNDSKWIMSCLLGVVIA